MTQNTFWPDWRLAFSVCVQLIRTMSACLNVHTRIARIYKMQDLLHCDISGCHNAELPNHTKRAGMSIDDKAPKVENTVGWYWLWISDENYVGALRTYSIFLPPFYDNLENVFAVHARPTWFAFCAICTWQRGSGLSFEKSAEMIGV